ncbi:MAG: ribosome assembly RNA-binding protein YhbY [Clostridia bacterium]|nr:ribosome assembly RNA-binding protein YhbY [Clostridia bacterium]
MLTSKQRAALRGLANPIDTILQVGKDGITDNVVAQADQAIAVRELIKGRVLENALLDPRVAAAEIAEQLGAEVVQVIGSRFVLYRPAKEEKNRKIKL